MNTAEERVFEPQTVYVWINEWTNERTYEQKNEWTNERTNDGNGDQCENTRVNRYGELDKMKMEKECAQECAMQTVCTSNSFGVITSVKIK